MLKCWNVEPEIRPRFEFCLKVLKSYKAMPLDYVNISHDRKFKMQNNLFSSFYY
jgi:hypothetical protein